MPDWAAQPAEAPAIEADEPTPKMIEAGLRVLYESGVIESPIEMTDRWVVRQIYQAMRRLQRA